MSRAVRWLTHPEEPRGELRKKDRSRSIISCWPLRLGWLVSQGRTWFLSTPNPSIHIQNQQQPWLAHMGHTHNSAATILKKGRREDDQQGELALSYHKSFHSAFPIPHPVMHFRIKYQAARPPGEPTSISLWRRDGCSGAPAQHF